MRRVRTVTSVAGPDPFAKALAKPYTSRSSANIMRRSLRWEQVMVAVVCFVTVYSLAPEQQRHAYSCMVCSSILFGS